MEMISRKGAKTPRRGAKSWLKIFALITITPVTHSAQADVVGQVGAYKISISTEPAVIPVGKARLNIKVTDGSGKPVSGAQVRSLVKMTSMSMGEKETTAIPQQGRPGLYVSEASFMMAGDYSAAITISGPQGSASGSVGLQTGQDTTSAGGISPAALIALLLLTALAVFTVWRMRATGQRVRWSAFGNRGAIGGTIMLILIFALSLYAISHWRRAGAMTPIEAQAMEMNTPAPPGTAAVTLAEVTRGPIESSAGYTGQAVGFNEQDVIARVQGWLTWMPFYNGQKVTAGELVGRLDTSQVQPQIAQQEANVAMARQGVAVASKEYMQSLAEVRLAHGEQGMREAAVKEAQANADAAREERSAAQAMLSAAQSKVGDAQAQLQAMQADQEYWRQEIAREKALLSQGAVSKEEYQREQAQAAAADSKVRQMQAGVQSAQSEVRAAQAAVRKADAMIAAADNRVKSSSSELTSHTAHLDASEAAAEAAKQKVAQMRAGVDQARAGLAIVSTTRGYSEIRAQISGVVTLRLISPGQLVNPGQAILRIAQVDPIRLQANVSEADLASLHVGGRVVVRDQTNARSPMAATITSITPSVDPIARTGVVEVVVKNSDLRFRPGQFVTMEISTGGSRSGLRIPAAAVHSRTPAGQGVLATGAGTFVWAATPVQGEEGQFTVSAVDVKTGVSDGTHVEIVSGLSEGERVVVTGGDYLKSGDTVTTGGSGATAADMGDMPGMSHSHGAAASGPNEATVEVSSKGFTPTSVSLRAGAPARLIFIRKDEKNCATEVVLPSYGIKRALPLNQPVVIEFTPKAGELAFTCGMNMLNGKVVAR